MRLLYYHICLLTLVLFQMCQCLLRAQVPYEIQPATGYCLGSVEYRGSVVATECIWKISHDPLTLFPYQEESRSFVLLSGQTYHNKALLWITSVYDVEANTIQRIDSCSSKLCGQNGRNRIQYLGVLNDTLVGRIVDTDSIVAFLLPNLSKVLLPSSRMDLFSLRSSLFEEAIHGDITYLSVGKNQDVAYSNRKSNQITILSAGKDSLSIPANMGGKVLGWIDGSHLLYADITVEGYGDFYYDLFVLDLTNRVSDRILSRVPNVYDYRHGQLIYENEPRKIVIAQLFQSIGWELHERKIVDVDGYFSWIYEVQMIDSSNLVILGDACREEYRLYKLHIIDK